MGELFAQCVNYGHALDASDFDTPVLSLYTCQPDGTGCHWETGETAFHGFTGNGDSRFIMAPVTPFLQYVLENRQVLGDRFQVRLQFNNEAAGAPPQNLTIVTADAPSEHPTAVHMVPSLFVSYQAP